MNSLASECAPDKSSLFTEIELSQLDPKLFPRHIAIIMDGNRRWAKKRHLPSSVGHWRGAEVLTKIVRAASQLGVKTLTVFAFSTENWRRPPVEIDALLELIRINLIRQRENMVKEGVKLETIGDMSSLPQKVKDELNKTKNLTKNNSKIELILSLNYGGRDEIRRAVQAIAQDCLNGTIEIQNVSEELFSKYLDTRDQEDPDLIIRTSGEFRLSNFMLWQSSYSEMVIEEALWPEFTEKHLLHAILEYQNRERRAGL